MKDSGGASTAKKPQLARQVLAQQSTAARVNAQRKMLQSMVKQSTPRTPPSAPSMGASKPMYSMAPRQNAGPGDDFLKWLVEQGTKVINGIGDTVTNISNKVPQINPEVSAPAVGAGWANFGNAVRGGMNRAEGFFSRMAPRNMR